VLAVGTVHLPVLLVVGVLCVTTGVLAQKSHQIRSGQWLVTAPTTLILLLTAYTALQAIPLPIGLLAAIAPHNADVWSRALVALGEPGPRWASISMDPGATWIEVLKGVCYYGVATSAITLSRHKSAFFGIALVFVSALLAGGFTIVHGLAGLDKVFGIYEPKNNFSLWHIGPLLNANHLCGYLNAGAMCGLGILLMREPRLPWWLTAVGVSTLIGIAASSVSRGGVLLIPVGVGLMVFLMRRRPPIHGRQKALSGRALSVLAFGAAGGGVILGLLGLAAGQLDELLDKDLSKLNILSWAAPLVSEHKLFGIGRGAFETVYQAYNPTQGHGLWTHPENIAVQWTSEWGVAVAVAAAGAWLWLARPGRLGATRSALAAGGWIAMLLLVLQNMVDFSLELPSVGITVACIFGSLWGDGARRKLGKAPESPERPRYESRGLVDSWAAVLLAVVGVAVLGLAAKKGRPSATDDRVFFYELSKKPPVGRETFAPMLREAMLRHPAEPYLPMMGAQRAWRVRDENPLPYLQRTLERSKTYGRAHLLLAEIVASRGSLSQAMMELRQAVADEPGLAWPAVELAARLTRDPELLAGLVPEGEAGAKVLDLLGATFFGIDREISARFDRAAIERDRSLPQPHERLAGVLVEQLGPKAKGDRCQGEERARKCLAELEEHAMHVERAWGAGQSRAARLRARAMLAMEREQEAWRILTIACPVATDRYDCLLVQIPLATRLKKTEEAARLTKELGAIGCKDSAMCSRTYIWIGDFSTANGNLGAAANAYERAAQEDPTNSALWIKVGNVAEKIGAPVKAIHAWEQAAKLRPDDAELQDRIRQQKLKVIGTL
jgi:tetratricopeptide (TPR) repeat protein